MKKNLIQVWLFMLFSVAFVTSNAQSLDSLKARYNLLKPWVNTGLLYERNPQNLILVGSRYHSMYYSGKADSLCSKLAFEELYETKYHEAFDSSYFKFHPTSLDDKINTEQIGTTGFNDAVLGFMDLDYQLISEMAYDSAWLDRDSAGFYYLQVQPYRYRDTIFLDTINFSTHPSQIIVMDTLLYPDSTFIVNHAFETFRLFAMGVLTPVVYSTSTNNPSITFSLGQQLFVSNKSNLTYEIDWGNGQGYVSFNPSQRRYTVQYPHYGEKTVRIRVANSVYSDVHPFLYSHSTFRLGRTMDAQQLSVPLVNTPGACNRDTSAGIGKGIISIKLANGRTALQKPLILVEGFDQGNPVSPENSGSTTAIGSTLKGYGNYHWMSLSSGTVEDAPNLTLFPLLIDSMLAAGYDVILLDLQTNRAKIQKNANLLIHVIDYVNAELRANQSEEEIVVLGASMGGLIARYALRKMELEECCHNVRLYGTFSTPHRGANIPIGLQHFVKSFGYEFNLLGKGNKALGTFNFILNSPAARQMLVYHTETSAAFDRAAFQHELDSLGQPQYCRTIALTDGSELGIGQLDNNSFMLANQRLMHIDLKIWRPRRLRDHDNENIAHLEALRDGTGDSIPPGDWPLVHAEAFAIGAAGAGTSQTVMKSWGNPQFNLSEYLAYADYYERHYTQLSKLQNWKGWFQVFLNPFVGFKIVHLIIQTNARLDSKFQGIQNANLALSTIDKQGPTLPYDNAPGDLITTQNTIEALSGNLAVKDFPHHNFVATVSALDIDTSLLSLNVWANKELLYKTKIPFEQFWTAYDDRFDPPRSDNRAHVMVDTFNIVWIEDKKRETQPVFLAQQTSGDLNVYFNFAQPQDADPSNKELVSDVFLPAVKVKAGGLLHINKLDAVAYQNSGRGIPEAYSGFNVKTSQAACEAPFVKIEGGGVFTVGDNNYTPIGQGQRDNNKADVYFRAGSTLELEGNSALRIRDNSKLVIEEGAELILHNGHTIELDGLHAVLEIRGKVTIKQNAQLKPTGNGYIRFAQPENQASTQYWAFEPGAVIELNGTGKSDKRAEVSGKLILDTSLSQLNITNCRIEIHPQQEIHIQGRATIQNALITNASGTQGRYERVVVYGQPNLVIKQSEFRSGQYGLLAVLPSNANALKIDNCDFKQCITALRVNGKNIELTNSRLDSNVTGLHIEAATASCDVRSSRFNRNTYAGIAFSGQSTAALFVHESSLTNNHLAMYVRGNCPVRLSCNTVTHNFVGLEAEKTSLLLGSEARNSFNHNTYAISTSEIDNLILANGFNNFSNNDYYLSGNFGPNAPLLVINSVVKLDVLNNRLPLVGGLCPVSLSTYDGTQVLLHNWQPMNAYVTMCPLTARAGLDAATLAAASTNLPVYTSFENNRLPEVLVQALSVMTPDLSEAAGNDVLAIERLNEVFTYIRGEYAYRSGVSEADFVLNKEEVHLLQYALNKALRALGNAYRFGAITPNRAELGTTISPQLQMVLDELDNQLLYFDRNFDETTWFYFKLAKAQAYRSAEHYDYALNELNDLGTEDSKLLAIRDYWICICQAEADFILQNIDIGQYLENISQCELQAPELRKASPGAGIPAEFLNSTNEKASYTLYPNPNQGMFTLSADKVLEGGGFSITNTAGMLVQQGTITAGDFSFELDASSLQSGIYFLQLHFGHNPVQTLKFSVVK